MYIKSMMFKILCLITVLLLKTTFVLSDVINEINIKGNDRVSSSTILNFSELKKGDDVDNNKLNQSLKKLYETNFFEDVNLTINNNTLVITVKEYPIIQEIKILGIKRQKTVEEIKDEISLKEKNSFNKALVKNDLNTILNIFKRSGYYFVNTDVKIEENSNNTVNIVYEIDRGEKATISEIKFIGDKKFKDRKLHSIITSEESRFWKLISRGKYLNIDKINLDKRLLKNFYLNKGTIKLTLQMLTHLF